jgi:hypothetical protein
LIRAREVGYVARCVLRTVSAICLAIGALALGPAVALGAAQWVSPVTVSDPGEQNSDPQVTFDGQGEVIAVWQRAQCHISGGPPESCAGARLLASVRPPGASFGAAQTLTGDPGTLNSLAPDVQVASDAKGGAVAVWSSSNGASSSNVRYALRAPGQGFGQVQTITDDPGSFVLNPRLAVDPAGDMIAVWISATSSTSGTARFAVGTTAQGFGPSQAFPGDASTNDVFLPAPQVAFDGTGSIIAMWMTRENNFGRIRVAIGSLQSFADPTTIDDDANQFDAQPQLATDGQGHAVVVLQRQVPTVSQDAGYALKAPGEAFGGVTAFGGNSGVSNSPEVAMAPGGRAIAMWSNQDGTSRTIRFATREPDQGFGGAQQMPDSGDTPSGQQVAFDGHGNALAVWTSFDSGIEKVRWASAPAGQSFAAPGTLPGPDQGANSPLFAFDPQGNAVAVWQGKVPFNSPDIDVPVLAAGYDAAGPLMRALSLPSQGDTAHALPFSVSPVDVWSPLGSTIFGFGDGQSITAQGASVQVKHTYKSAGTHQVTVTATDALGNASTAGAPVKILDRTPPLISAFRMTRRRFAVGPHATPRSAARRRGGAFRFRLSERAKVTIKIARRTSGRRVGRRCLRPTPRLRKRRSCVRYVSAGTLTRRHGRSGLNTVRFSGRVGRKALKRGRYRATLRATDAAGNRSRTKHVTFRIVA